MYELKDELARHCLPAAKRDDNRGLAWVNSICLLFLLIGLVGAKRMFVTVRNPPPLEETVPAVVLPVPPPPAAAEAQNQEQSDSDRPEVPQVVVVVPAAPNINFSVPTIGNVVAPSALAAAPPLNPLRAPAPLRSLPTSLSATGAGGERPQPPYPRIAQQEGMQGKVTLLMTVDDAGIITDIHVEESSGYPLLDRGALDFVKRHWTVPPGTAGHTYETSIIFKLNPQ